MSNESEMNAQEQATCHRRVDTEERGPHWECKLPGVNGGWVLDPPYCPVCGTGLRAYGTEQARADKVDSEAVKGTRLWAMLGFTPEYRRTIMDNPGAGIWGLQYVGLLRNDGTLTDEGRIILAALQQSALAPAEWLANVLSCEFDELESCSDCQFMRSSRCSGVPDNTKMPITELRKFCQRHILSAALAATGSAEPTDTQLLDALEQGMADGHIDVDDDPCSLCDEPTCEYDYDCDEAEECPLGLRDKQVFKVWRDVEPGMKQGMLKITADPREAAKALLAQAGGADRG